MYKQTMYLSIIQKVDTVLTSYLCPVRLQVQFRILQGVITMLIEKPIRQRTSYTSITSKKELVIREDEQNINGNNIFITTITKLSSDITMKKNTSKNYSVHRTLHVRQSILNHRMTLTSRSMTYFEVTLAIHRDGMSR